MALLTLLIKIGNDYLTREILDIRLMLIFASTEDINFQNTLTCF